MPADPSAIIRKFRESDREEVRRICCATGFMGEPVTRFFDADAIFADALTRYFTDFEPESCFVAECQGKVAGYLTGAKDVSVARRVSERVIIPRALTEGILSGKLLRYKNIRFFWHCLASLVKGEFSEPDFSKDYPATLHINILEGFRGAGLGARLIGAYTDYLICEKVRGVYFATLSERASDFFRKQGFELLHKGRRSYYRYILGRDIPIYIYGKRLI